MTETTTAKVDYAALPYKVNKYGFPIVECTRCGGCGRYSFNPWTLDRCFGCQGSGWQIPKGTPRALYNQLLETVRAAKSVTMGRTLFVAEDGTRTYADNGVAVGDKVRPYKSKGEFVEVTAVRHTRRINGTGYQGAGANERLTSLVLTVEVTFADGTSREFWGESWDRQPDTAALVALRNDLSAQARAAYDAVLARRAKRSRKA